jgi:hypothetical protein
VIKNKILVSDVKDLGEGKFSVRLDLDGGSTEHVYSQTQTVSADGYDTAVEIARRDFEQWIKVLIDSVAKMNAALAQR